MTVVNLDTGCVSFGFISNEMKKHGAIGPTQPLGQQSLQGQCPLSEGGGRGVTLRNNHSYLDTLLSHVHETASVNSSCR